MKFSTDLVIFDLEASCKTFGKNTIAESNIIEIGAVKLDRKTLEIKDEFSALIQPRDYPISPEIEEITNISPEMVAEMPLFKDAALAFTTWYGKRNKSILAGWGLYYDLPLLRKEFMAFDLTYSEHFLGGGFDIKGLAYYWLAKGGHSTSGVTVERLIKKLDVQLDFQFHRALDDARATAIILKEIYRAEQERG